MEQLKMIKEQLVTQVQSQMGDLSKVNTHELGEVIDMIKDLSESIYHCTIVEAMDKAGEETRSNNNYYYTEKYYPTPEQYYRDMDRGLGRMYYPSNDNQSGSNNNSQGNNQYYTERDYPWSMRDYREGKSPMRRKMYMESKDTHADSSKSMQELEAYMSELSSDMMEMLEKASPEEKMILQKKINTLATKIQNV